MSGIEKERIGDEFLISNVKEGEEGVILGS